MQFDSLLEFCTIAEIRNFTVAAEHLFLSEATLSRRIKKLEEEIGAPLFYRTTRRIELTTLGKVLLPYAQRGIALKSEMDDTLNKLLHTEKTRLNIAAIGVAIEYINFTDLLTVFNAEHPDITINIQSPNAPISSLLSEGIYEMGFIPELAGHEDLNFDRILIKSDRITALIPKNHSFAKKKSWSINDLENERLFLISDGSPMFNICMQICQIHGFQPKVILTMLSGSSIRNFVEKELGIGLLLEYPSTLLHHDFPIGDKLVFGQPDPPICVNFNLIYSKNPSRAAKSFISLLKRTLKSEDR
jgi:DNA-binding transcriptional LysR family regulator